ALGWKGNISFTPSGPGKGTLAFSLRDRADRPLMCQVTAVIFRPIKSGVDQTITLAADLPGDYKADIDVPFTGLWEIRIKAESEGEVYQQSKRLVIP
ncbi:MAG: FixH family protein, partial [Anaerolineae bacterium]|nr:FixH family protein [Anaerolineae bacterium]